MNEIYKDISHPASLGGVEKLYKSVKDEGITRKDVKEFLQTQDTYTLHKVTRKKFQRRKYICKGPGHTICIDTAYMDRYKDSNNNVKFLIVFIDMYSRYLTVYIQKSLKSKDMEKVLSNFFKNSIMTYRKVLTDEGIEFTSKIIQSFFKTKNLHWYTVGNREIKVGMVERVIRTLKETIGKVITLYNNERYTDHLKTIIERYNNTKHRGLNWKTPLEVHLMTNSREILNFSKKIYKMNFNRNNSLRNLLSEGQVVRLQSIAVTQSKFNKSYFIQNTTELFKVNKVNINTNPVTYTVSDLDGDVIKGTFYHEELIPVKNSGVYDIEIIKKRKRRGKNEYLVKYINYPYSKAEWVKEVALTKRG